ncbi:MAG: helix-turn-helix domain-containing protein, partial [Chromatiaceae bacterium]|nr:helix-turn-helix domain-containing protein [Chromatiaceae bacterium]
LVAAALDLAPEEIWPDRYGADGRSNRRPGRPAIHAFKDTGKARGRKSKAAAEN